MLSRMRDSMVFQRLAAVGPGLRDSLFRDNRVIPLALGALAVLILFWIVVGFFLGGKDNEPISNRAFVSQSPDELAQQGGTGAPSPEVEIRNADSYAAYQSKDPFRELIPSADSAAASPSGGDGLPGNGSSSSSSSPSGGAGGGGSSTSSSASPSPSSGSGSGTATPSSASPTSSARPSSSASPFSAGGGSSPSSSASPSSSGGTGGGNGGRGGRGGTGSGGSGNLFDSGGSLPY